jgi:hypothetical protein
VSATSSLDSIVSDAAFYLLPQLTTELKAMATASNWPKIAVESLSVIFDGSNISVDYPKEMSKVIENLEYGNASDMPNSVIRSFIYRSGETLKSVLADRTVTNLFESERVFSE